jgi:deoxycytidylate deaminase
MAQGEHDGASSGEVRIEADPGNEGAAESAAHSERLVLQDLASGSERRELVFGVVAPLGVDKRRAEDALGRALTDAGYELRPVRVTTWLREFASDPAAIDGSTALERKRLLMDAGDEMRRQWSDRAGGKGDAVALAAIAGIQEERERLNQARGAPRVGDIPLSTMPLDGVAFFVDSFKHPDELDRLRRTYGPAFVSIGIFAAPEKRREALEVLRRGGDPEGLEDQLMRRDENDAKKLGQRVADAFFACDFIVKVDDEIADVIVQMGRLVQLIFGNAFLTPSKEEYGMSLARTAQVRSGSLARQIGAAILRSDGSVVSAGTNEVPRPLSGGQYWPEDDADFKGRDMVYEMEDVAGPRDASDWFRGEMVRDALDILSDAGALAADLAAVDSKGRLQRLYLDEDAPLRKSRIGDNIDYVRAVHAEAAAIIDAARHGTAVLGATMYSTTFPCHECARHIVDAGIREVVYLEPYPKSGTKVLYRDSIAIDPAHPDGRRVVFRTFVGVAPARYLEFFSIGERERKLRDGRPIEFELKTAIPSLPYYTASPEAAIQTEASQLELFRHFVEEHYGPEEH